MAFFSLACATVSQPAKGGKGQCYVAGTRLYSFAGGRYAILTFSGCVWNRWYNSSGEILWKSISNSCFKSSRLSPFPFFGVLFAMARRDCWRVGAIKGILIAASRTFHVTVLSINRNVKGERERECVCFQPKWPEEYRQTLTWDEVVRSRSSLQ